MNFDERGALIGMILGDGCLRIRKRYEEGREEQTQTLLQISHSIKQVDYCKYKADRVNIILGGRSKLTYYDVKLKGIDTPYRMCRFVKISKVFTDLRNHLYTDGKKVITPRFLDWLSAEGLAYWFLDDGHTKWWRRIDNSITSAQIQFAVCRPVHECDLVIGWLQQKYGINAEIKLVNKQNMLYMRTQDVIKLFEIIKPHTPKSMLYKVDPTYAITHEYQTSARYKRKMI